MKSRDYNNDSYLKQRLNSAGKSPYDEDENLEDWENDDLGKDPEDIEPDN